MKGPRRHAAPAAELVWLATVGGASATGAILAPPPSELTIPFMFPRFRFPFPFLEHHESRDRYIITSPSVVVSQPAKSDLNPIYSVCSTPNTLSRRPSYCLLLLLSPFAALNLTFDARALCQRQSLHILTLPIQSVRLVRACLQLALFSFHPSLSYSALSLRKQTDVS